MQRRQFLHNGLLLGAAGSLLGAGFSANQLSGDLSPPLTRLVLPPLNASDTYDLLIHAIDKGQLDIIKSLIRQGVNVNAKDDFDSTPLHRAVMDCFAGHFHFSCSFISVSKSPAGWRRSKNQPVRAPRSIGEIKVM